MTAHQDGRRRWGFGVAVLALAVAAGCSTASSDASDAARRALRPVPTTTTAAAPSATEDPDCKATGARASLAPSDEITGAVAEIRKRGQLIVGVDENTDRFAARDPGSGEIKGLEVDLVHEIAAAITGNSDNDNVVFKTVVTADKNRVVADGDVDLTASADSMSCERWSDVAFSTEYFTAQHKLMVPVGSDIVGVDDLAGRTVCVTAGSSSVKLLAKVAPDAHALEVPGRTDCLVALQDGTADAYLAHDTFLRGMRDQDPNMTILPDNLQDQHYGIAIGKKHPELVRFVNAVLQRMRDDGTLEDLYSKWLGNDAPPVPAPCYRDEGDPCLP
jgi:polar amino acid transport system substrate-binding protein